MTIDSYRRRNSLRLPGYDYAQSGAVFVTICTAGRQRLFGSVHDGRVVHTASGAMAIDRWKAIPGRFPDVTLDALVVMPDHVHGMLIHGPVAGQVAGCVTTGEVVRWFKASVHAAWRSGVLRDGWPAYDRRLWQRDYYDRIVRTEHDMTRYRGHIDGNPGRWWESTMRARSRRPELNDP